MWRGIAPHSTTLRAGSGRVEETRSFAQKNSQREFFCAKEKTYHAAAGETGFHRVNARFARSPRNACHFKDTFTG
jgi:hypothetical protein